MAPAARPLVSIVVRTCRGRLGFLREAIGSLLAQDHEPLEIVVVEDGSGEARQLVEQLSPRTGHSVVYRALEKVGRSAAGNVGLELARGELLGFLDDDDRLFPHHVATLVEPLEQNSSVAAAYSLACEVPTRVTSHEPLRYEEVARYVVHRRKWRQEEMASRNFLPIQAVLFRRELFRDYGGFNPQLDCFEDWDLWRRYLQAGAFAYVPCVTSMHRVPAEARLALARYRRMRAHRPLVERHWTLHGPQAECRPPSLFRRAASRALKHALPFQLYWHGRIWWYARRQRRTVLLDQPAGPLSHVAPGELPRRR